MLISNSIKVRPDCFDRAKPHPVPGVHTIEKQHVEMDVEVQRTAEALDQGHCTGLQQALLLSHFIDHSLKSRDLSNDIIRQNYSSKLELAEDLLCLRP